MSVFFLFENGIEDTGFNTTTLKKTTGHVGSMETNDFVLNVATVNGSGSQSSNNVLVRSLKEPLSIKHSRSSHMVLHPSE